MARYINANELTEEISLLQIKMGGHNIFYNESKASVLRIIDEQPTADVVEVVRCRDCKHYTNNIDDDNLRDGYCNLKKVGYFSTVVDTDYCSYGEKKKAREESL